MDLRPTKTNQGASGRCRGIDNWDRAFNRWPWAGGPSGCVFNPESGGWRRGKRPTQLKRPGISTAAHFTL